MTTLSRRWVRVLSVGLGAFVAILLLFFLAVGALPCEARGEIFGQKGGWCCCNLGNGAQCCGPTLICPTNIIPGCICN